MASARETIVDIAKALSDVFEKHTRSNRRKAWHSLTSEKGHKEVDKLIVNPKRSINTFKQLTFKEWLEAKEHNER